MTNLSFIYAKKIWLCNPSLESVYFTLMFFGCSTCLPVMKAGFVVRVRSILRTRMRARNFFTRLPYFPYPKVEHIRHHRHPYLQVITYFGARHIYLSRQKSFSGNIWRQGWLYECAQFFGHERGRAIFLLSFATSLQNTQLVYWAEIDQHQPVDFFS